MADTLEEAYEEVTINNADLTLKQLLFIYLESERPYDNTLLPASKPDRETECQDDLQTYTQLSLWENN